MRQTCSTSFSLGAFSSIGHGMARILAARSISLIPSAWLRPAPGNPAITPDDHNRGVALYAVRFGGRAIHDVVADIETRGHFPLEPALKVPNFIENASGTMDGQKDDVAVFVAGIESLHGGQGMNAGARSGDIPGDDW